MPPPPPPLKPCLWIWRGAIHPPTTNGLPSHHCDEQCYPQHGGDPDLRTQGTQRTYHFYFLFFYFIHTAGKPKAYGIARKNIARHIKPQLSWGCSDTHQQHPPRSFSL